MPRFFHPELPDGGETSLPDDEAHHFARVLRGRVGQTVTLFDGHGRSATGEVVEVGKRSVRVRLGTVETDPPPVAAITVAIAPPKGDRFRWAIEKLTELGVGRVLPIRTARSVTDPGGTKLDKLRQTSLAACKQCGRNRLMTIDEPVGLAAALAEPAETKWIADRGGQSPPGPATSGLVLVGPEGGWTDDERDAADVAGCRPLGLGETILRTETAAIAAAVRLGLA